MSKVVEQPVSGAHSGGALNGVYTPIAAELKEALAVFRTELRSHEPYLAGLYQHVEQFHGKHLRPALLLLTGRACGGVTQEHVVLAAVVEMVHLATLVHDDVLDNGLVRRRADTVNRRWGSGPALLLGDLLFSHAYRLCSTLDSQAAAEKIASTAILIGEGELQQVAQRGNLDLTEAEYLDIITRKTAVLIGASMGLGAEAAGTPAQQAAALEACGRALGVAFQIVDDLLDLLGDERQTGKTLGRDAAQGELTLPVVHLLAEGTRRQRDAGRAILQQPANQASARRLGELLEEAGSIAYARRLAQAHVAEGVEALEALPPSAARQSLLELAGFIMARRH